MQQLCLYDAQHVACSNQDPMQWSGHDLQSLRLVMQFYEDSCLLKQRFVMADDQSVQVILCTRR